MHFNTKIELVGWREDVTRPGLAGRYRQAVFRVTSDGIAPAEIVIYVHPAWPAAEHEKIARSFVAARLSEGLAALEVYEPAELDRIWRKVKPDDATIESGP